MRRSSRPAATTVTSSVAPTCVGKLVEPSDDLRVEIDARFERFVDRSRDERLLLSTHGYPRST